MSRNILEILTERYPHHTFDLEQATYGGNINGFFIFSSDEAALLEDWENIRNTIGVYFQSKLDSEFEIWNIYLFFITELPISSELKHKIEHDTVSSRKIVIDNHASRTEEFKKHVFSEHITNSNLLICDPTTNINGFARDETLAGLLDSAVPPSAKKSREDVLMNVLVQLEKAIKDEI